MTELELRELRKTYRARGRPAVDAVRGLDLALRSGKLLGLLGPSGCGKSTTLRMIAGLETVTGGDILVDGRSAIQRPAQARDMGVAFENYAPYPPLTVAENLAFGLKARRRSARGSSKEVSRKVTDIAERVGLTNLLDARPAGLSSGQKQRVSLADRIAVMKDGVIQQLGTPYEIYDSPANVFVAGFVGEPAINLLRGVATDDGHARLSESVRIALPVPVTAGREVVVGIRPEDLHLRPGDEGLAARVVAHEPLLESGIATPALEGVELVVLTDPEVRPAHGDEVHVTADPDLTHVFDAETGDSLR